ncbi:MAG: MCE family protein [Candidatus Aureabacteria bacterium]|nr:MCE family protein [Candidatus Auribacterota bacterium]
MKKKKSEVSIELTVGLFVTVGMLVLAAMIIRLGSTDYLAYQNAHRFSVHFSFADGILEKAPVRYAGVEVGRVEKIRLTSDPKQRVILDLVIKNEVQVREKDTVTINSLGLMSEMYVEIVPGDQTANALQAGTVIEGKDPVALQQVVTNAKKVLEELEKGVKIFSEEDTKENIKHSLKNIRALSENVNDISKNMQETAGIMRELFADNKENISESISEFKLNIKGMRKSVDSMERIMARIERGEGLVGKLLVDKDTSDNFSGTMEKISVVLDDIHEISLNIKEGKGAVGLLMTDEEIQEKLKKLITEIEKNPWRLFRKK